MTERFCIIGKREDVLEKIDQAFDFVSLNCFCCNVCWHCNVVLKLRKESVRVGIKTFNSDIKYWSIDWEKNENGESMPKLTYYLFL